MENPDIQAQINEISSIRGQISVWRSALVLIMVLVLVICVGQMWGAVTRLTQAGPTQQQFVDKLTLSTQQDILPQIQDVGTQAWKSIDFNTQVDKLNARAPEVAAAALKEAQTLSTNIPRKGKEIISAQFEKALKQQAAKLTEEFPDVDEEELRAFLGDLAEEAQTQVTDLTDTLFTPHIETMNAIVADIEAIKTLEGPAAKADIPTWEMAFLIIDIARADFAEEPATAGKGTK
ncbi:MAG TPA: hypothetical protein PLZ36_07730 [Armatimonadota bacterium]|nr:hypothetical protein [Armatimonadota bacterium]HOS42384.1 hypothetical protein [Armatimonadota bacterium]